MTTPKDSDLREALRRKYADTPQMPADFISRMHQASPDTPSRPMRCWLYPISAVAVAASVLLLIMLNIGQNQPKQNPVFAEDVTKPELTVQATPQTITQTEVVAQPVATHAEESKPAKKHRKVQKTVHKEHVLAEAEQAEAEQAEAEQAEADQEAVYLPKDPDPYRLAVAQAQEIRSRGEQLYQEVAQIISNSKNIDQ